ncbi:hypothetical protein FB446DRAFT_276730 [Lentinula raphanica]|nr:hypothetical protein FB446DRAFT_276730 [Lentinula raphanica]
MAHKRKADISLLFHPRKNGKNTPSSSPRSKTRASSSLTKAKSLPVPTPPQPDDDEADLQPPDGPYLEFRIMSSALNGWKYIAMKFESRKGVDIMDWEQPIKLNRKNRMRESNSSMSGAEQAMLPMLGYDGQPVIGSDGKVVMVGSEAQLRGSSAEPNWGTRDGSTARKKRARQVFSIPDEVKRLRNEEKDPWVIEDASGQQIWTAQFDDPGKAETHAFLIPYNDVFKFVPSHRHYKFQKKLTPGIPTAVSVYQKSLEQDPAISLHRRNGKGPSAATTTTLKDEAEGQPFVSGGSLVHQSQQSLGPRGRRLKAVDNGIDDTLEEDEEDSGVTAKRRAKESSGEGDVDEMVYDEYFTDDEEDMDVEKVQDQEAKDLELRLKREYRIANQTFRGHVDTSDGEEENPRISREVKKMQQLLRNREGNEAYESEEEDND